ncbi:MAG: hypothetical protein NWF01_05020 [Candidatus Bathyarchaeota archaeon]|nr:hypothetical protein [Candidatus Bathyarchaeota archaeon]
MPPCGYWAIKTDILINSENSEKGDKCLVCNTIFAASNLVFIDSEMCTCGHPKSYHEENVLSCTKGNELNSCTCEKYRPTEVTVKEAPKKE